MARKITLPNGLKVYHLNKTNTEMVYQDIFVEHHYRRHGIEIRDGDCILDIGANIGLFQIYLNQICSVARVISCEPIPEVFAVLQKNIQLCDSLDSTALNIGLSRQSGSTRFTYYPRLALASTMYPDDSAEEVERGREYVLRQFREYPNRLLAGLLKAVPSMVLHPLAERIRRFYRKQTTVSCRLRTVSEVIAEYKFDQVNLLKINAERSEIDILAGIDEPDWTKIRQIVVETHDGEEQMHEVRALLTNRGFEVEADQVEDFPNIYVLSAVRPVGE